MEHVPTSIYRETFSWITNNGNYLKHLVLKQDLKRHWAPNCTKQTGGRLFKATLWGTTRTLLVTGHFTIKGEKSSIWSSERRWWISFLREWLFFYFQAFHCVYNGCMLHHHRAQGNRPGQAQNIKDLRWGTSSEVSATTTRSLLKPGHVTWRHRGSMFQPYVTQT